MDCEAISWQHDVVNISVYVAGPMTGIAEHNVPAFVAAAKHLRGFGCQVVTPPELTENHPMLKHITPDGSLPLYCYQEFVRLDYEGLLRCNTVVVLPGWRNSKGSRAEVLVATMCGFPIYELDHFPHEKLNVSIATVVTEPGT